VEPGASASSQGTSKWAGGPITWPVGVEMLTASFGPLTVQCLDDGGRPVAAWPLYAHDDEEAKSAAGVVGLPLTWSLVCAVSLLVVLL
jgi:hypothetical protein